MATLTVLNLEHVCFKYPSGVTVLHDLSLAIDSGETVVLMGVNGAGKTTLFKLIFALEKPTSGSVWVASRDTRTANPEDVARVAGYVAQQVERQLFARSVLDEVAFGPIALGWPRGLAVQRAEVAIDRVGLTDESKTHPMDLPPAKRKLVGVAAAIVTSPKLLLLDEPTQGFDLPGMLELASLLRDLALGGMAIFCVSHDMNFVAETFDRALVLEGGKISSDSGVHEFLSERGALRDSGLTSPPVIELSEALDDPETGIRFAELQAAVERHCRAAE